MKTGQTYKLLLASILLIPLAANNPDHGSALIERIRNNTDYPVNIEGKKTIHDLLPAGTVVRIKSRKADYGNDGKYYAVRKERGGYFLKADTTDSSDRATELVVKRHFSKGEDSLGFYSATANKQMLRASDNQAVQLTDKSFASDDAVGAQWKISGGDLKFCYLQNRKTTGFLSPLTAEDQRDIASEIDTKKINQTPRTNSDDERRAIEQNSLMLSYGDTVRIVHNKTLNQIYGDQSRYKHSDSSGNAIVFAVNNRPEVDNSNPPETPEDLARALQNTFNNTVQQSMFVKTSKGEPDANTWIIKGPHDDSDRFNAPAGTAIQSGATIRFEHVLTGKNLHCTKNSSPPASGGSAHQFEVSLFGNDGVGNDYDNWNIAAYGLSANIDKDKLEKSLEGLSNEEMVAKLKSSQGKKGSKQAEKNKKILRVGQTFILNHSATEASLFSENVLFNIEPGGSDVSDERSVWQVEISTGTPTEGQKVRYRDKIRLRHTVSNNYLNNSKSGISAIEAESQTSGTSWRIKGAHKENERWNAKNEFVENKSIIRLESRFDGKNLYSDNRQNSRISKKEDGFFFVEVQQIGQPGVGNEEDNWQLEVVGASGPLLHGSKIILNHQGNLKRGESSQLFSHSKELELETNEVAAKKYIPRKKVVQNDAKTYQRVSAFNTQNKDRLTLQKKRNLLKKEDDKKYAEQQKALKERIKDLSQEEKEKAFEDFEKEKKEKNPELTKIEIELEKDNDKMAWFIDAVEKEPLPTENIAWTGFPNGSPAEEGANEIISIEIVTLGMGGNVPPKATVSMGIPVEQRPPTISGYATDNVKGFDQSYLLNLSPMLSKGVAWLEKSLETPGKASLSFLVKTGDQGEAQIVLGTELGLDFVWKILIGAGNNTNSQIIKKDLSMGKPREIVVAKVDKTENPLAITQSGNFMPYWVSINDGTIIVGAGHVIGKDVFMTWSDPEPRAKNSRIGFATHKHDVQFTGVQIGSPVGLKLPYRRYTKLKEISSNSIEPTWLSEGLRIPGQGTIGFYATGAESLTLTIASADTEHKNRYALTLTSDEKGEGWDGIVSLSKWNNDDKKYHELASTKGSDNKKNALKTNEPRRFWISLYAGQIFVGLGNTGDNPFLHFADKEPLDDLMLLGLSSSNGSAKLKKVTISPPMHIELKEEDEDYQASKAPIPFSGNLSVIAPYKYKISQEGPAVKFVDVINKKTFYPGKVPQQGAEYYFMLELASDGLPTFVWTRQPENPELISKKKSAYLTKAAGQALTMAASYTEGPGLVGGLLGAVFSTVYAGVGGMFVGKGARKEADLKYGYKKHSSYVQLDKENYSQDMASAGIPVQAKLNRAKIEQQIALGNKWQPSSQDKLERLIALYQQVVLLVNHPYTVRNTFIKQTIFENISTLYHAHKELHKPPKDVIDLSYSHLINLLMTAYNNPYLTSSFDAQELQLKESWLGWANQLARKKIIKKPAANFTIKSNLGEYIWLPEKFKTAGKGAVSFQAKGTNDIMACISPRPMPVRGTDNEIYEVSIGSSNNTSTQIRARSLDKAAASTTTRNALANSLMMQTYWISVNNGRVVVGKNKISEKNKVLEWLDPYPVPRARYVGISSWDSPVTFKNIKIEEALPNPE